MTLRAVLCHVVPHSCVEDILDIVVTTENETDYPVKVRKPDTVGSSFGLDNDGRDLDNDMNVSVM